MRNWNFIDRRLERLVERVVPDIRDARPACRVTVTEIERRVAARGWLAKRRLRLPRTWRTMRRHLETIEDFRARRLECTIDRMMLAAPDSTPEAIAEKLGAIEQMESVTDAELLLGDHATLIGDTLYGLGQISELVSGLKNFSRLDQAPTANVSLNDCVESALLIAKNALKNKVEVIRQLGELPRISCAPSQT